MNWKIEVYTMLLERAEELGNPEDITYYQRKLQKEKAELQRDKDIKFLFVSWLVIFSIPFLIDFFGWY